MNRTYLFLAFACVLMLGAGSALGTTADFQCNCSKGNPNNCVCDASRTSSSGSGTSCGAATPTNYFWDWGDGTSYFNGSYTSHSYYGQFCEAYYPRMTVFCSDGSSATRTHCYCNYLGINGCIRPGAGWTP